jgi:hypothetical protein
MIDAATIINTLYERIATDAAGASVRALVNSIFEARDPINLTGKTIPYLMWRGGSVGGQSGEMRPIGGRWFAYVDSTKSTLLLLQIMDALEAVYGYQNRHAITHGHTVVVHRGDTFYDQGFKLHGAEIRVQYLDRG